MAKKLKGEVFPGTGNSVTWPTTRIREIVGRPDLHEGTLNVRLSVPHKVTAHYTLPRAENNRAETLYFERCVLFVGEHVIPGLIARTSTNFHGPKVLEVMADVHIRRTCGLNDGDAVSVEVER
jgi:CTP-dependent riboflavin kinase